MVAASLTLLIILAGKVHRFFWQLRHGELVVAGSGRRPNELGSEPSLLPASLRELVALFLGGE